MKRLRRTPMRLLLWTATLAVGVIGVLHFRLGHDVWLTPDQRGRRLFESGRYAEAAQSFRDPMWLGTAWYRAGEFEKAAQSFARRDSAEAKFNEGNAWVMLGKYERAIASYDKALARRLDWLEAQENRDLAAARAQFLKQTGGDLGDQKVGADKVVFDRQKSSGGQDTQMAGERASDDATMQAMWLRRVDTRPADFLQAKFAYQQTLEAEAGE